ncbi:LysR family transcriptional regulator [Sodalis sp. RH20]|uniref:LysR family transcriptional regulator n=1 Tax=unclassified Sodalis (in: enterobacteria) TaxID=2636512 RepID=UPI0039B671C3
MNQSAKNLKPVPPLTEADLKLLRIFRMVAEAGGLTAAEEALNIERSTISRHLQNLEARLGEKLCFRGPAGFQLTLFGESVLRASSLADDTLKKIRDDLNDARNILAGDLTIGIADNCLSNSGSKVSEALAAFRSIAPDVTVHLSIHQHDSLLTHMLDRQLHIGISGMPETNRQLQSVPLFNEAFRLYVAIPFGQPSPGMADLIDQNYVLVTRDRDPYSSRLSQRLNMKRKAVASGLEAVATLIAAGGYVGLLPTHYVQTLSQFYCFVEVADAQTFAYEVTFSLLSLRGHPLPPSGQRFMRLLLNLMHQETRGGFPLKAAS